MSLGTLTSRLRALINRKDFTDVLAVGFITDAIADLEREVRFGPMETILSTNVWVEGRNAFLIPNGYLETLNLFTDTCELTQVDLATFLRTPDIGGSPKVFAKIADRWLLRPTPAPETTVYLHYYSSLTPLLVPEDTNVWVQSAVNATLYTAAALAADFYQMEDVYSNRFSTRARGYVEALNAQALDEAWSGRMAIPFPQDTGDY